MFIEILMKAKQNGECKIPHTLLKTRIFCFSL